MRVPSLLPGSRRTRSCLFFAIGVILYVLGLYTSFFSRITLLGAVLEEEQANHEAFQGILGITLWPP